MPSASTSQRYCLMLPLLLALPLLLTVTVLPMRGKPRGSGGVAESVERGSGAAVEPRSGVGDGSRRGVGDEGIGLQGEREDVGSSWGR